MVAAQSNPTGSIESKPSSQFVYSLVGLSFLSTVPVGLVAPIGQAAEVPTVAQPKAKPTSHTRSNQQSAVAILHVSPTRGNDVKGNGSQQAPLKTITHALAIAQPNTVILLAPGTYTTQTGEAFPLKLKAGVTLQGNPQLRGQGIVIQGGGEFLSPSFASQNVAILGANGAGLTGVTVTNPNPRGYGLWIESTNPLVTDNTFAGNSHDGVAVVGNSVSIVRNNHFSANQANGISVLNTAAPQIQGNVFEQNGFGANIAQNATPVLIDNKILQNQDGIVVQAEARPKLRRNVFEGNRRDGLVAIASSLPDLGTSTESGDNIFRSNGRLDINANATSQVVPAYGNQVLMTRVAGQVDLVGALAQTKQLAEVKQVAQTKEVAVAPADLTPVKTKQLAPVSVARTTPLVGRSFVHSSPQRTSEPTLPPIPRAKPQKTPTAIGSDLSASAFPVPASLNPSRTVARRPTQVASTTPVTLPTIRTTRSQPTETAIQIPVPPPETSQIANRVSRSAPPTRLATPVSATATQLSETNAMPAVAVSQIRVTRRPPASSIQPTTRRLANSGRSLPKPRTPINATPVTKPTTPVAVSVSSRAASPSSNPQTTTSIDIAVPPPESNVLMRGGAGDRPTPTPPTTLAKRDAVTPRPANLGSPISNPELLPVPSPNIPMGNAGDSPEIFIARASQADEPPLPPTRISAISLRYRVVVETMDEQERSQLISIVPDAFQTVSSGRSVMQVGAFGERTNADQLQQMLTTQGLRASVEQL